MGKKKKKNFVNEDEFDEVSTDEEKESNLDQTTLCPHVGKAVNVSSLKKALKAAWIRIGACGPCAKDKRQQKQTFEGLDVWMCLKCGVQACGSKDSLKDGKGHAQVSFNKRAQHAGQVATYYVFVLKAGACERARSALRSSSESFCF